MHQKLKSGKFSWPTMRPQACMIIICAAFLSVAWFNNHSRHFLLTEMEIHEGMSYFLLFWLKRGGPMDRCADRLSYRDLKKYPRGTIMLPRLAFKLTDEPIFWVRFKTLLLWLLKRFYYNLWRKLCFFVTVYTNVMDQRTDGHNLL